jgi:MerR family transcriptional regulator, copper efflux regulator
MTTQGQTIGSAARQLGTTARTLRYREALGLLSPRRTPSGHRLYGERELLAAAVSAELESRYQVPPVALSFALRALLDSDVAERLYELARLAARIEPPRLAALGFDQHKAQRLLRLAS